MKAMAGDTNPLLGFVKDIEKQQEIRSKGSRSSEEDAQSDHVTKKAKPSNAMEEAMNQEEDMPQAAGEASTTTEKETPKSVSFRDMVLHSGAHPENQECSIDLSSEDIIRLISEELYTKPIQAQKDDVPLAPFNPKPKAKVSMEEYETWCNRWKLTLIVCLLEKKASLKYMAAKLQHL